MQATQRFAQGLVEALDYWIGELNASIDEPVARREWLNQAALQRSRVLLRQIPAQDRAAIFEDFGSTLIYELARSLEQRTVHAADSRLALVDADTGALLPGPLHEFFMDALVASRASKRAG